MSRAVQSTRRRAGRECRLFCDFFGNSEFFQTEFDSHAKRKVFYKHFRNGILHQAQTKGSSLVRFGETRMIAVRDPERIERGLIVDRMLFHKALFDEFNGYLSRLRSNDQAHDTLRGNCRKTMCYLIRGTQD
jgi:hypothetical protein